MKQKVKVALIGCGQISDAHLSEIALIENAEVVAVCDLVEVLAEDTADRFNVKRYYSDYKEMIKEVNPDVVHITTPPQTQLSIGSEVLKNGCHAYIEKPFGINLRETEKLIEIAENTNKIVCAGFSELFDVVSIRLKKYIEAGLLGEVVHVETYYGDCLDGNFAKLFLQNKEHWLHSLPGKLFQNIISHAIYHIVPYFDNPFDKLVCFAKDRSKNGVFQDELRVMIESGNVTSFLTYTCAVKPIQQFIRIYGTKSVVELDFTNHIFSFVDSTELPGPVARLRNGLSPAKGLIKESAKNFANMALGKDRFFAGMGNLFGTLYNTIQKDIITPPVSYSEVLKVSAIIDEIAKQCSEIGISNN